MRSARQSENAANDVASTAAVTFSLQAAIFT
jgi:hypothetical protein